MLPVGILQLLLEDSPIVFVVSGKKFDNIHDFWTAIIADALTFLGSSEAVIFAFNVPTTKELRDVVFVEVKRAWLPRASNGRLTWAGGPVVDSSAVAGGLVVFGIVCLVSFGLTKYLVLL
jgi:hypothetical protein